MSLYSSKRLHSYNWQDLPIDKDVIDRVQYLAKDEGAPIIETALLIFTWKQKDTDEEYDDDNELINTHIGSDKEN